MSQVSLGDLWESAWALEEDGDFAAARDAFYVAADAAEEVGFKEGAREARRRALQNHIAVWAKTRWPSEQFHPRDVTATVQVRRRGGRLEFALRRRTRSGTTVGFMYGTVGRRGDVRMDRR